jgi:hypothetical protein
MYPLSFLSDVWNIDLRDSNGDTRKRKCSPFAREADRQSKILAKSFVEEVSLRTVVLDVGEDARGVAE